jgi:hypothetical protein
MNNKKVLGVISVIIILILIVTNTALFRLYITELREKDTEVKFYSNWYCIGGVYNTMLYYEYKYDFPMNRSDYDNLTYVCGQSAWTNISLSEENDLIRNFSIS